MDVSIYFLVGVALEFLPDDPQRDLLEWKIRRNRGLKVAIEDTEIPTPVSHVDQIATPIVE